MRSIYFRLSTIGLFLLQLGALIAQPSGYDELIKKSPELTPKQRFFRFFQHQRADNEFANAYIHLADACEKIYTDLDPLRDYQRVVHWINNAFTYYSVFPVYLDNRDARRNTEYYEFFEIEPAGKKLRNGDLLRYTKYRKQTTETFLDSLKLIYGAFEKSKDHYNKAVELFNEINHTYENLNKALLRTDSQLLEKLNQLEQEFEASKKSFAEYKKMIHKYPLKDYDQTYTLRPIETYRLDGLTNSDFLNNEFHLWNYSQWIKKFRQLYNNDIVPLRKEVAALQEMFEENHETLAKLDTVNSDASFEKADRLFMYRLGKYDHNSLIRDMFRYYNERQNLEVMSLSPINQIIDSVPSKMNRKFRYYYQLAMQKQKADARLSTFRNHISEDKKLLFQDFFETYYPGEDRLYTLADEEAEMTGNILNEGLSHLQTYLANHKSYLESLEYAQGGYGEVPLTPYGNKESSEYITQAYSLQDSIPEFVSGILKSKDGVFVARISPDRKVKWLKTPGTPGPSKSFTNPDASVLSDYENGVVALISSRDTSGIHSSLVHYSKDGETILEKKMNQTLQPELLHYDEINKQNLMAFQTPEDEAINTSPRIEVCLADSAGNIQWNVHLSVEGHLIEVVKPADQYVALINAKKYQKQGEWIDLPNQGLLIATISNDGELSGMTTVTTKGGLHIDRIFPVSGQEITLIGKQGISDRSKERPCYLVISTEREVIFDNLESM